MVVISDRFTASTYAYQVFGRGIPEHLYHALADIALSREPDMAFIIDNDPQISVDRAKLRLMEDGTAESEGKFEQLGEDFYKNVRSGFLTFAADNAYVQVVDGSGGPDDVFSNILRNLL
jgi:dTMP kinase